MKDIKTFFREYFKENGMVSSRRANVLYVLLFYSVIATLGIFTAMVKSENIFSVVTDSLMFIIIAGTLGVTATDVFKKYRKKEVENDEEEKPEQPKPPKPEPPKPSPKTKNADLNVDLDFIRKEEGERLEAYKCSANKWTIGFGNTTHPDGRKVKKGDVITKEQADEYLIIESRRILDEINLPDWMNKNQRTAVLSWVYNCGIGSWKKSLLKELIMKKSPRGEIYERWTTKWLTAQGSKEPVLKPRRIREAELYFS